jgi:hypothetical protein
VPPRFLGFGKCGCLAAACRDGSGKHAFGERRPGQQCSEGACQGYPLRIATESGNIVLHPIQRRDLIEQTIVSRGLLFRFRSQVGVRQKAHKTGSRIGRHYNYSLPCQRLTIQPGSTLDARHNHNYRPALGCRGGSGPDV